jgi:hypothetical protein
VQVIKYLAAVRERDQGQLLFGDAALGRLQAACFGKYRTTVREDKVYHLVCRLRGRR